MEANNETEIRRKSDRYHVRLLTPTTTCATEPFALYVEAPTVDLRRLVVVGYVDFRPGYREEIGGVVKFSKKGESPDEKRNLRLATPADFRESGYEPGIADDLDAAQRADMAPYLARQMTRKGSYVSAADISASVMFAATAEPWVYCASIAPTWSYGAGALRALKREFAESKGSDSVITAIDNPRLFARQLGIEFALGAEVGKDTEDDLIMRFLGPGLAQRVCGLDALPQVDTVVWVSHGPVHYEDRRLIIETEKDMPTMGAVRACFTKRMEFSGQREYRFAVHVAGRPLRKAIYLEASGELLRLTRRLGRQVVTTVKKAHSGQSERLAGTVNISV